MFQHDLFYDLRSRGVKRDFGLGKLYTDLKEYSFQYHEVLFHCYPAFLFLSKFLVSFLAAALWFQCHFDNIIYWYLTSLQIELPIQEKGLLNLEYV